MDVILLRRVRKSIGKVLQEYRWIEKSEKPTWRVFYSYSLYQRNISYSCERLLAELLPSTQFMISATGNRFLPGAHVITVRKATKPETSSRHCLAKKERLIVQKAAMPHIRSFVFHMGNGAPLLPKRLRCNALNTLMRHSTRRLSELEAQCCNRQKISAGNKGENVGHEDGDTENADVANNDTTAVDFDFYGEDLCETKPKSETTG